MKNFILDILTNPNTFFQNVISEKERLNVPLLIVFCGAIIAGVHAYLIGGLTAKMMAALSPGIAPIITISAFFGGMIATFLVWLVLTGVFFGLSFVFKGQGSFRRCLEVTGYGYLPQIIGSLISLVVAFLYVPKVVVPEISSAAMQDPALIQDAATALMHDPAMLAMTQFMSVISIVFLLWSANIWIFGMHYARNLSLRDAAICVGTPVLAYVIYVSYTVVGA